MRIALSFASLLVLTSAAGAQVVSGRDPGMGLAPMADPGPRIETNPVAGDLRQIRRNIRNARSSGQISKKEARAMLRDSELIGGAADRFGSDGYSDSEQRALDMRTEALRSVVDAQRGTAPAGKR